MIKYVQECRDENEIISFFKLRGKNLNIDDAYNLKSIYNNSKTKLNNKNKLTLNQLDKVAGGFYIVKELKQFEKNGPIEPVYSLMLGKVPFKDLINILGDNCKKKDYFEKCEDPNFIPIIDKTHKSDETGEFEPTISLIPIKHYSMRTLRIELLQGILNNTPVEDIYSEGQKAHLHTLFFKLTSTYFDFASKSCLLDMTAYVSFISNLWNKTQLKTQKQALKTLLFFSALPARS